MLHVGKLPFVILQIPEAITEVERGLDIGDSVDAGRKNLGLEGVASASADGRTAGESGENGGAESICPP